mmetsp:Transcript_41085/g.72272  ORF Transcript_41085/g.72272 Transcript_41085/m.72272 type:complete len:198 (+) Transcript_41085:118-711(+)
MSDSIHSPLGSDVFSSLNSLSPPPTPIAKRERHFFTSIAATPPTPMFFPTSQSLFSSSAHRCPFSQLSPANKEAMEEKQLASLASRPAPSLRLMSRSGTNISQASDVKTRIQAGQILPLPFSFPGTSFKSIESSIQQMPSLSDSSKSSDSANLLESTLKKPEPVVDPNQQVKLPSFQRSGVQHRTVKKRNSIVARTA